ncbi:MAG: leucine-rich repeat protein [Clostridia bacterium]|nr:leucine-rich repeat protein [Clostridia bacterium]
MPDNIYSEIDPSIEADGSIMCEADSNAPQKTNDAKKLFDYANNYFYGRGIKKNFANAVDLYKKAALRGHNGAYCRLGYCYENGLGVEKNLIKALEYYEKAAERGDKTAKKELVRLQGDASSNSAKPTETVFEEADSVTKLNKDGKIVYKNGKEEIIKYGATEMPYIDYNKKKNIIEIIMPNSIKKLDFHGFANCSLLKRIVLSSEITNLPGSFFWDCGNLTEVSLPEGLVQIESNAFWSCSQLTSIKLPSTLKKIGADAFSNCKKLSDISLPDNLEYIGEKAFHYCNALKKIEIPANLKDIGGNPFSNINAEITVSPRNKRFFVKDKNLYKINYGGNTLVAYIPKKGESSFDIPKNITSIGDYAFASCRNLSYVSIPNGVTSIGKNAFEWCWIREINIPDTVKSIGDNAFYYCSYIRSLEIPTSIESIGDSIVDGITVSGTREPKRLDIYYKGTKEQWLKISIKNNPFMVAAIHFSGKIVYSDGREETLLYNLKKIEANAYAGRRDIVSVTLPMSVTCIGEGAFAGCKNLKDIYYYGSRNEWKKITIEKNTAKFKSIFGKAKIHYNT